MIHLKCGKCGTYFEFEPLSFDARSQLPPGLTMDDYVVPLCQGCFQEVVNVDDPIYLVEPTQ